MIGANGGTTRLHPGDMVLEPLSSMLIIINDDGRMAIALWIEPEHSAEIVHTATIGHDDVVVRVRA